VWDVELVDEVEVWLLALAQADPNTADQVEAAIDVLAEEGPGLGRPLVDRIKGSAVHNLKELRPGSSGASEIRILFVFDPARRAILLVAGDKSGDWSGWYRKAVPLAERRYAAHLATAKGEEG
jgi:hypothetical protein